MCVDIYSIEICCLQDHPSSDSFYDSDFADGETVTVQPPQVEKQQDKDSVGSQQDQFENAEVDGEWGRQRMSSCTVTERDVGVEVDELSDWLGKMALWHHLFFKDVVIFSMASRL